MFSIVHHRGEWSTWWNRIASCSGEELSMPPLVSEVSKATRQMCLGKAGRPDGIPVDVYKFKEQKLIRKLTSLFCRIWKDEKVPQEFHNANIVHLYKCKGIRSSCYNHRGISLLATAGKILGWVILNRITKSLDKSILPESQFGFRPGRGTSDMVCGECQLQE